MYGADWNRTGNGGPDSQLQVNKLDTKGVKMESEHGQINILLVSIQGDQTVVGHLESGAESHLKPSGGWKASGTS